MADHGSAVREIRTVADLRPARRNHNRGTKRGSDLLDHSITSYGVGRGIVVDRHGQVIAGNHVLEKVAEHGFDVVVVPTDGRTLVVTQRTDLDLDHDQAAVELAYADNRTQQVGFEIDPHVVREDLAAGVDLSGLYFEDELHAILSTLDPPAPREGQTDPDALPEQRQTDIRPGDVFALGAHRLGCGDTTDAAFVATVCDGRVLTLLHADPPYGMGKEADGIANDNLYGPKLDAFQRAWLDAWTPAWAENGSAYVWGTAPDLWRLWYVGGFSDPARNLLVRNEIVWAKGNAFGMKSEGAHSYPPETERCLFLMRGQQFLGNQNKDDYWPGYEPLRTWLLAQRDAAGWSNADVNRLTGTNMAGHWFSQSQFQPISWKHYDVLQKAAAGTAFVEDYDDLFDRLFGSVRDGGNAHRRELAAALREQRSYFDNTHEAMTDVWPFGRVVGEERYGHATPKPVALVERAIATSTPPGADVGVPFAGTCPEVIAAERLGRRVVAVELEPAYCQIVIDRWEAFTGQTAVRVRREAE